MEPKNGGVLMKIRLVVLVVLALMSRRCGEDSASKSKRNPPSEKLTCSNLVDLNVNWDETSAPVNRLMFVRVEYGEKSMPCCSKEEGASKGAAVVTGLVRGRTYHIKVEGHGVYGQVKASPQFTYSPPTCEEQEQKRLSQPDFEYPLSIQVDWETGWKAD